ncbi:MAG: hypothetical protein DRG24_07780 [Epsilonproteobacteria bacterium]|nr:MAG: hypothetical protein DRG24_07780 [Campylobacterota bacterium]
MKRSTFDSILSFLLGTSWAFIIIGAWGTFNLFSFLGFAPALFIAIFFVLFGLFGILLLETLLTYRQRHEEQQKQTKLLYEIKTLLEK